MNVEKLGFNIEVVPGGTSNLATPQISATQPGMAAASRINVRVAEQKPSTSVTEKGTAKLAPFSAYKLTTANAMDKGQNNKGGTNYNKDKDGDLNESGKYTYVLSGDDASVAANTVYYVDLTIWIEGTDDECDNSTTGTTMQFYINFAYAQTGEIAWNWQTGDSTNATAITLANINA